MVRKAELYHSKASHSLGASVHPNCAGGGGGKREQLVVIGACAVHGEEMCACNQCGQFCPVRAQVALISFIMFS